jgi:hypothetical protein
LQLPADNAHDFGPFVTAVVSIYKYFPPAVLKGLEGEKRGHVIFRSTTFIAKLKINTQMGPPNPKRRMGRNLPSDPMTQNRLYDSRFRCQLAQLEQEIVNRRRYKTPYLER